MYVYPCGLFVFQGHWLVLLAMMCLFQHIQDYFGLNDSPPQGLLVPVSLVNGFVKQGLAFRWLRPYQVHIFRSICIFCTAALRRVLCGWALLVLPLGPPRPPTTPRPKQRINRMPAATWGECNVVLLHGTQVRGAPSKVHVQWQTMWHTYAHGRSGYGQFLRGKTAHRNT